MKNIPARPREEAHREEEQVEEPAGEPGLQVLLAGGAVGPVDEQAPPLHILRRQRPPEPAVVAVVAVVPHHEVVVFGHPVLPHPRLPAVDEGGVVLGQRPAVHQHLPPTDLQRLARQPHDPLDEVALRLLRELEHDHIAALDRPGRVEAEAAGVVEHLVHQQVVADQQVLLHGAGGDLERLEDEGAYEEREDHRDADGFEVLPHPAPARGPLLRSLRHRAGPRPSRKPA